MECLLRSPAIGEWTDCAESRTAQAPAAALAAAAAAAALVAALVAVVVVVVVVYTARSGKDLQECFPARG